MCLPFYTSSYFVSIENIDHLKNNCFSINLILGPHNFKQPNFLFTDKIESEKYLPEGHSWDLNPVHPAPKPMHLTIFYTSFHKHTI